MSASCAHANLWRSAGWAILALFLSSCGSTAPSVSDLPGTLRNIVPPKYSIITIIHGDGDYLYHDSSGLEYRADEEALARVTSVATHNPGAEVFVFHEKSRSNFLLFFSRPDGQFSYYREGRLIAEEPYWRDEGRIRFSHEAELTRKYGYDPVDSAGPLPVRILLYFGHEIPEVRGPVYDESYPDRPFSVRDFAAGLAQFDQDRANFDLLVLSTCYGGTPHTISSLAPYAKTIIASPENLHLSYLDLTPFERLEIALGDGDVPTFAKSYAKYAFDKLSGTVQTAVTLAVYDADRVGKYLGSVESVYDRTLGATQRETPETLERCDCAEDPEYIKPGMDDGVEVFYRAARFGRSKLKESHSGWGCLRINNR